MARRRRNTPQQPGSESGEGSAPLSTAERLAKGSARESEEAARATGRTMLFVVLAVFIIFEIAIVLIFRTGEEIHWKRELVEIDSLHERGSHEDAARRLAEFGKDWPGAVETFDWNRKMGLYHAAAGDWATAAQHYARAAEIDPRAPRVRAAAGEAYWKTGDRKKAVEFLGAEIDNVPRALGDHDRANFYLGIAAKEQGDYLAAFRHFQSIADTGAWQQELDKLYAEIETELIEPTRTRARETSIEELPGTG